MANFFKNIKNWFVRLFWATEMDITIVGLQNAGKTSLLRVLAGGEFTVEYVTPHIPLLLPITNEQLTAPSQQSGLT
jgi:GTPase SAR1 family protein